MAAPLDNRTYYDEFSDWYERERHRGYHALIDALELSVAAPEAEGRRVLEAGCGTGLLLQDLARRADLAVGADLSAGMIARAASRGLRVVQASVNDLPFPDASFDLVCSFKVLAHVPRIDAAVAELARVTRPGGRLFLEFYNRWSLRYLAKRVRAGRISDRTTEAAVFTRWEPPREVMDHFPDNVRIDAVRGVRVFTPFAALHRVPVLGHALGSLERWAVDSPLRWFGGFFIVVATRTE